MPIKVKLLKICAPTKGEREKAFKQPLCYKQMYSTLQHTDEKMIVESTVLYLSPHVLFLFSSNETESHDPYINGNLVLFLMNMNYYF